SCLASSIYSEASLIRWCLKSPVKNRPPSRSAMPQFLAPFSCRLAACRLARDCAPASIASLTSCLIILSDISILLYPPIRMLSVLSPICLFYYKEDGGGKSLRNSLCSHKLMEKNI